VLEEAQIDIAIITVVPEEYIAVHSRLENTQRYPGTVDGVNPYKWETGEIQSNQASYRVVLAFSGSQGVISGATITNATVLRWNPRYVFLVDVAGGLNRKDLSLGDIVIANPIWFYDYGKIGKKFEPCHRFQYPANNPLFRSALLFAEFQYWKGGISRKRPDNTDILPKVLNGTVASGNQVIDNPDHPFFRSVLRSDTAREILAVEVEGAGAADAIVFANLQLLRVYK
jgi:nucleoside phosphorylase